MSVLDIVAKVITKYTADVSDQKAKLAELAAAEKELGVAQTEAANAHAEAIKGMLGGLVTLGAAIGVAKLAWDGYKEGVQEAKLAHAAAGVDMERLSKAAGGLKDQLELLTFAAKAHKSAWGNSQGDLETAERAMRALEARGIDTETATNAVTNAVVGLKTKGLKALGIEIDDSKLKMDEFGNVLGSTAEKADVHKKILAALGVVAKEVADGHENIGDSMKKTEVKLSDAWRELKKGLGDLVLAMQPLLSALATAVGLVGQLAHAGNLPAMDAARAAYDKQQAGVKGQIDGYFTAVHGVDTANAAIAGIGSERDWNLVGAMNRQMLKTTNALAQPYDINKDFEFKAHVPTEQEKEDAARAIGRAMMKDLGKRVTTSGYDGVTVSDEYKYTVAEHEGRHLDLKKATGSGSLGQAQGWSGDGIDFEKTEMQEITKTFKELDRVAEAKKVSFVEKAFGKIDEIHMYKEAFSALTESVGAGYKAMVEGTDSFGHAFKKSIGNVLEAEGSKMQVLALENLAYGVAAIALGPIGGISAAGYFEAAAMFEAGAIAAGLAASALGAGGGGGGKASAGRSGNSAPSSVPAGAGAGGHAVSNTTIIYGDNLSGQTTRQRGVVAAKLIGLTTGPGTGKDQVVYA